MRNPEGFKTPVATCGCDFEVSNNEEPRIVFCNMHSAAGQMLETLKRVRSCTEKCRYCLDEVLAAIAAAERED